MRCVSSRRGRWPDRPPAGVQAVLKLLDYGGIARLLGQIVVFGRIAFVVVKFELAIGVLDQPVAVVADGPLACVCGGN